MRKVPKKNTQQYPDAVVLMKVRSLIIDKVDRLNLNDAREVYNLICKKLDRGKKNEAWQETDSGAE